MSHAVLTQTVSWWRFFDSESHFTAVQKECATPPHIQVRQTMWLSFTRPFPRVSTASDKRWGEKAWVLGWVVRRCGNIGQEVPDSTGSFSGCNFVCKFDEGPIQYRVVSSNLLSCSNGTVGTNWGWGINVWFCG